MGKGEIAPNKQFLLFPQCFQKACFPGASKGVIVWEWVNSTRCEPLNPLSYYKIFDMTKLKAFADNKLNVTEIRISLYDRVENTVGKGKKCWLPAFSSFSTGFPKPSSLGSLKVGIF